MICGHCGHFRTNSVAEWFKHTKTYDCRKFDPWAKIVEAKKAGNPGLAERLTKKLLGVSTPMSPKAKERLREYAETHKEEIKERRRQKKEMLQRLKARTEAYGRPRQKRSSEPNDVDQVVDR